VTKRAQAAYCLVLAEEDAAEQEFENRGGWSDSCSNITFSSSTWPWLDRNAAMQTGAWRLGTAMFRFWEIREHFAEAGQAREAVRASRSGGSDQKLVCVRFLRVGVLAGEQGDYATAIRFINESKDIARPIGNNTGVAIS